MHDGVAAWYTHMPVIVPDNAGSNDLCKELHSKIHQSDGLIHIVSAVLVVGA